MLNSSTLQGRQTRMGTRRVVGANLVPTLVRLAECADEDLSLPARAVVLAVYGNRITDDVRDALAAFTADELETMLDVMSQRCVTVADAPGYLVQFLGAARERSDVGHNTLAQLRDAGGASGEIAERILVADLLGRVSIPVRLRLVGASAAKLRGLCDELAEHDMPDTVLSGMLESFI